MDITRSPDQSLIVNKVHYQFDGWGGDALLESAPIFIGTRELAEAITSAGLTGVEFDKAEISKSIIFNQLQPGLRLPQFLWFKFYGTPGKDDFGLKNLQLVVSQRALDLLKDLGINNADVEVVAF